MNLTSQPGQKTTPANYAVWMGLLSIAGLGTLAAKFFVYFPGDVAGERWVQAVAPQNLGWAQGVSRTAEFPWIFLILALICVISWALAGWRAVILAILSLVGMLVLGALLGPVIARPRPSPELVRVLRPLSGYSFPSLFALRYAATFGFLAVLTALKGAGVVRTAALIVCSALLLLGFAARVALAAHWPSDVLLSYLIGLLWASFLVSFV